MDEQAAFDILIVGSGPSGVHAAVEAARQGAKVALLDVGYRDEHFPKIIPPLPFSHLRASDIGQAEYFVGDPQHAMDAQQRAGAHLTPPRKYMIQNMETLFPLQSTDFLPLQATSAGGLGVSWGANVFTLSAKELTRIGMPASEMERYYKEAAAEVGVSGRNDDEAGQSIAGGIPLQPPLDLDTNARSILSNYTKAKAKLKQRGFVLGQSAMAILSQAVGDRRANPYRDMDFYSDEPRSVYRPQFTLDALRQLPNFHYLPQRLAVSFEETADGWVRLKYKNLSNSSEESITAKKLILAAGAINSGRLVLQSQPQHGNRLGILSNPNVWIAAINLPMLGRVAQDARYSLAQLTALLAPEANDDCVIAQFYSYRSLLYFRMLNQIPLPPSLGVQFLRFIATAFTCVNVHFPDYPAQGKWIELNQSNLSVHYEVPSEQAQQNRRLEKAMLRCLRTMKCFSMGVARPAHGASIHYGGTLPYSEADQPFTCDITGRLHGTRSVYVADGSTWKYLPAQGLTFTLMANARRVAREAIRSLAR